MDNKHLYIEQDVADNSLYKQLQESALKELQRLSGNRWTNFNAHDPGMTIGDTANFVLTEMDYKLGFDLIDYLTTEEEPLEFQKYGFFLPEKVYPTAPITVEDYRKFLLFNCPLLSHVKISVSRKGEYEISGTPFSGAKWEEAEKQITQCFHANRNLCETLGNVKEYFPEMLYFHSELYMEPGEDPNVILASLYWEIMSYLSGNVHLEDTEKLLVGDFSWEEWFEGPTGKKKLVIPEQSNTMSELYVRLTQIKGIRAFKMCSLFKELNDPKNVVSDFSEGFRLFIPQTKADVKIVIRVEETEVDVDIKRFHKELEALYTLNRASWQNNEKKDDEVFSRFLPVGVYRRVFGHRALGRDLPVCYKADIEYPLKESSVPDRTKNQQLGAYLRLFDLMIHRGLKELQETQNLLSINNLEVPSRLEVLAPALLPGIKDNDRYKKVYAIKNQYLDFLDHLYGVDSNPPELSEFYTPEDTEDHILQRRMTFLKQAPYLTKTRFKAKNIKEASSATNVPTIQAHLAYLLGLNIEEKEVEGDVDWVLVEKEEGDGKLQRILDAAKIEIPIPANTGNIEPGAFLEFQQLSQLLPFFQTGEICGGLFRGGISIDRYKAVRIEKNEYILAFWNREEQVWMDLGHFTNKKLLKKCARTLARYLYEQNLKEETVYVLEDNLLYPDEKFSVSFFFPSWTTRCKSLRFRDICSQWVRSLLPAHIQMRIYWLLPDEMEKIKQELKNANEALRKVDCTPDELKIIWKRICGILLTQYD